MNNISKTFLLLFVSTFLIATSCSQEKSDNKVNAPKAVEITPIEDPAIAIIASSNCKNCHNKSRKSIGPSYHEIARKYEADSMTVHTLISKIKKGGSGVWGNVPMEAHPELREDDIKAIVDYILSLDK